VKCREFSPRDIARALRRSRRASRHYSTTRRTEVAGSGRVPIAIGTICGVRGEWPRGKPSRLRFQPECDRDRAARAAACSHRYRPSSPRDVPTDWICSVPHQRSATDGRRSAGNRAVKLRDPRGHRGLFTTCQMTFSGCSDPNRTRAGDATGTDRPLVIGAASPFITADLTQSGTGTCADVRPLPTDRNHPWSFSRWR